MELDLRRPTLVVTGQWNPAIFDPSWIAKNLLGLASGTEMSVTQVLVGNKITNYYGSIGISVSELRVELFLNEFNEENQARLEKLLLDIAATLPHTPVQAMGVNFHFLESDVGADLVDKLKTYEQIESHFEVRSQSIISVLKTETAELNLRRDLLGQDFEIDFNYHHSLSTGISQIEAAAPGAISRLYKKANELLGEIYGLNTSSLNFIGHEFPASPIS